MKFSDIRLQNPDIRKPLVIIAVLFGIIVSCGGEKETTEETSVAKLPIFGERYYDDQTKDTVYHQVPEFELINQDSVTVTEQDLQGKIYIADFFFTSCPTMCPKMTSQMKRVAKKIEGMDDVYIVSHTVDPLIDTLPKLRAYAKENGINTKKWWFLWGDEEFIHEHGGNGYLLAASRDSAAPGGFLHASEFVLIDKSGRIRGIYDGTSTAEVDKLIGDIDKLKQEYNETGTAAH